MKKKELLLSILLLSIFVLLVCHSSNILAVGISGAVYEKLFFEPGLEKTYEYDVISNTDRPMNHEIGIGGPLAQYFTLSTNVIENIPVGGTGKFTATLRLPQELAPGEYRANICAGESQPRGGGTTGETSIGVRAVACAVIIVFSPYPGKHVEFSFSVKNVSKTENATFVLNVQSTGTDPVTVRGVIELYNQEIKAGAENKIITLNTPERTLSTGQTVNLNATLNVSDFEIGEYKAKAILYFDGEQSTKETLFRVGDLYMEILDFTREISQNKLNPINIKVESKWNGPINNVYAALEITDLEKNVVVSTINSPPANFLPWETKNLVAYWDTTGFREGEYGIKITLHYEDRTTVKQDKINVKFVEGKGLSSTTLLLLILIIVVIVLILVIIRMMKKMKSKAEPVKIKPKLKKKK